MLINFVDATNDANHYTKPPPKPPQNNKDTYNDKKMSRTMSFKQSINVNNKRIQ